MKHFLTKAFEAVSGALHKTHELFDYAGFLTCCLMVDESFMRVQPTKSNLNTLERAAFQVYEIGRRSALSKVHNTIQSRFDNPHDAPRPSIKGLLKEAAGAALPYIAKPNVAVPLIAGIVAGLCITAAYIANTGHLPHGLSDLLAPWLGSGASDTVKNSGVADGPQQMEP